MDMQGTTPPSAFPSHGEILAPGGALDSTPTKPGHLPPWVGEDPTEERLAHKSSSSRRWLFGLLVLGVGMLLIVAFYLWATYQHSLTP